MFSLSLGAQVNLVPNPSFEILDTCPYLQNQVHFAPPWYNPSDNSPDLYNRCSFVYSNGVPANWTGGQEPRTGDGYAGLAAYGYYYNNSNVNGREYIAVQFLDTMKAGKRYCIEFYASRADSSFWAVNRLGLCVSASPIVEPQDSAMGDTLNYVPVIQFDTNVIFQDTTNWIRISGTYVANGGEKFICIGNFYADNQTDTISHLGNFVWAYYYIDDVAVYEIEDCLAGNDISICYRDSIQLGVAPKTGVTYSWFPVCGLSDPNISNPFASPDTTIIYTLTQTECDVVSACAITVTVDHGCHHAPTIFIPSLLYGDQNLFIYGLESNSKLELFDDRGRLIFSESDYQNAFWTTNLAAGIYVVRLIRPTGEFISQKLCIVR